MKLTAKDIAQMIDHSILRPELTSAQVIEDCKLARKYNVVSVCVRPCDVSLCKKELKGTDIKVTTVIGFPHGTNKTVIKVAEALAAIDDGAVELDMVLNIGRLKGGDMEYVEKDILAVVEAAHSRGAIVKVILENCYLTDDLKEKACLICEKAGADFVKTSTGFGTGGATIEDLKLMRKTCNSRVRVKAAGGVRDLDAVLAARAAGTVRVGTRSTKEIMDEALRRESMETLVESDEGKLRSGY
ncbi:MAG: deoxyribose-phosphate aldolase [Ruminiclostridium sp.]|nr:deoxyribose-phosphate aldolase [Ruminiclostridium sp.]